MSVPGCEFGRLAFLQHNRSLMKSASIVKGSLTSEMLDAVRGFVWSIFANDATSRTESVLSQEVAISLLGANNLEAS